MNSNKTHLVILFLMSFIVIGCSTKYPNQNPTGKNFPSVTGNSLEKETIQLPESLNGKLTVLLLGYVQNSQFDIDRWLIGLDMTKTNVDVIEVPTIQGLFPQFFQTQIDNGMRKGIPKALWKGVVTVYEDGDTVQSFTGNINPNNSRVILLDDSGTVVFFYDDGFSVAALNSLREKIQVHRL